MILPQIADLAHAREATALAKYPPLGSRGVGYSRAMGYGGTAPGFFEAENRRTLCYAMIETPGALGDVEAIARLDTVDGLFIGPADLSMTRGRGPFKATAKDLADFAKVASAAAAARKAWAIPAPGAKVFDFARRHGAALVTVCDDLSALRRGFTQGLAVAVESLGRWRRPSRRTKFLAGRVAWVTGGATGIGRATAVALATARAPISPSARCRIPLPSARSPIPRGPVRRRWKPPRRRSRRTGARCFLVGLRSALGPIGR